MMFRMLLSVSLLWLSACRPAQPEGASKAVESTEAASEQSFENDFPRDEVIANGVENWETAVAEDGKYEMVIRSTFTFGDLVSFKSLVGNGVGDGIVIDIAAQQDGALRYQIFDSKTGMVTPGIYEDEMTLLRSALTDPD